MKKFLFFILFFGIGTLLFSQDALMFSYYFSGDDYEMHYQGLYTIVESSSAYIDDEGMIDLLITELQLLLNEKTVLAKGSPEKIDELIIFVVMALEKMALHNSRALEAVDEVLLTKDSLRIQMHCIRALGKMGDDDNYTASISIVNYCNRVDLSEIGKHEEFSMTIVKAIYGLTDNKPLDIVEHLGLLDVLKTFADQTVFPEQVAKASEKVIYHLLLNSM